MYSEAAMKHLKENAMAVYLKVDFLGKMMVNGMNGGHAKMADWGISHLPQTDPKEMLEIGCGSYGSGIFRDQGVSP